MNKKIFLTFFVLLALVLSVSACSMRKPIVMTDGPEKIKVAATIFPLYDIVREVGGENIETVLILPAGASPHTYEATPSEVKAVQGAKIMFRIGGEVDAWAAGISNAIAGVEIEELNNYLDKKPFGMESVNSESNHISLDAPADGEEGGDFDPHTWLDPVNANKIAERIAVVLGQTDPTNKEYYMANAQNFIDTLTLKDKIWQEKLNGLEKKDIIVFHDAWGYFADHFGLRIAGAFEPFPGKSPSPSYLVELQKKVQEENIETLFVEPQFSQEAVDTLAQDMKVNTAVIDPIGGVEGRNTYIELIDYNVNTIYDALQQ